MSRTNMARQVFTRKKLKNGYILRIQATVINQHIQTRLLSVQDKKQTLAKYGKMFQNWINTDDGKNIIAEHKEHEKFFKDRLSKYNLSKMTEQQFMELYKKLWASNVWRNKDWYVKNRLIQRNGLEKIKQELTNLLYGTEEFTIRYDEFRKNVSGLAVSSISEILHFIFP